MVKQKSIPLCIVLSIVTCGIYGIIWFINITDDTNTVSNTQGTTGIVAFLLSIVTCGIYNLYWCYKQGEKLDAAKNEKGIVSSNSGILYLVLSIFGLAIVAWALMQDSLNKLA